MKGRMPLETRLYPFRLKPWAGHIPVARSSGRHCREIPEHPLAATKARKPPQCYGYDKCPASVDRNTCRNEGN